jgi:uncharacterized protein (DUF362 family)
MERKTARVAVVRCGSYEPAEVSAAVREAVSLLGGISRFVRAGERVLVKPNLLSAKAPDRAITTHPTVVEALCALVREAGGTPFIGDSPGGAIRGLERVWRNTGMLDLSERTGVPSSASKRPGPSRSRGSSGRTWSQGPCSRPMLS